MDTSFRNRLIATRDRRHSKNHPFFEMWMRGELTKEQMALYCIQHYHFVNEAVNWLAYESSQVPHRDVKRYLFENLLDEENPNDPHPDMLKDWIVECGLPPESAENGMVLPGTEGLINWGWRLVHQRPWQVALAGIFIGLESQFLDICKGLTPALQKQYGYAPGAREIRFFEEHIIADAIHSTKGFAIVEQYCDTAELQHQAVKAVEEATIKRWGYMNGIYWFALRGRVDDTPLLDEKAA